MAYSGQMQWRTRAGDEVAARLGEPLTKDMTAHALRTALDPKGAWIPSVLEAADRRLSEVRRHVPDAGGLVIATDQESARAYAQVLAAGVGGEADGRAVRREGRLEEDREVHRRRVALDGGRADGLGGCRRPAARRRRLRDDDLDAAVLRPGDRPVRARPQARRDGVDLRAVGAAAAGARLGDGGGARPRARSEDHRRGRHLRRRGRPARAGPGRPRGPATRSWASSRRWARRRASTGCCTTAASSATRARCTSGRRRRWTSSGSPACSSPTRCATCSVTGRASARPVVLLRRRPPPSAPATTHEQLAVMRRELNGLVAAWYHRTGQPHGVTHAALRKECGGPAAAAANAVAAREADRPAPRVGDPRLAQQGGRAASEASG